MATLRSITLLLLLAAIAQFSEQCVGGRRPRPRPRPRPPPPSTTCDRSIDPTLLPSSNRLSLEHPDGHTGTIHLEKYYLNDEERVENLNDSTHCRFTGHLANDPEGSCVAMTGCPGGAEDLELTIISRKFGNALLVWKSDGSIEDIPHPYTADRSGVAAYNMTGDELYPPTNHTLKRGCPNGGCRNLQSTMRINIRVGYDYSWANSRLAGNSAEETIKRVFTHAQAHYCHSSLGTKVQFSLYTNQLYFHEYLEADSNNRYLSR